MQLFRLPKTALGSAHNVGVDLLWWRYRRVWRNVALPGFLGTVTSKETRALLRRDEMYVRILAEEVEGI